MKAKTLAEKFDHFHEDENEEIVLEKLRNFQADSIWFDQHYEDLKKNTKRNGSRSSISRSSIMERI
jgi:hypothetical protein